MFLPVLSPPLTLPLHCSNVASFCASKLLDEGAVVLGMSDSRGAIYREEGIGRDLLQQVW